MDPMKIAVIGGGAAGLMAAATINETNPKAEVFVFEKNDSLGKKVVISGGGRCNVTTGLTDLKEILTKYPRGNKFLISAFNNFPPEAVIGWFEEHGVPLKCEADNRVFPASNRGTDIVKVFETLFTTFHTKVLLNQAVTKIERVAKGFIIQSKNNPPLQVQKVILALGGQAYRHTGSTGDGYTLAESLSHTITTLGPSLHSFITKEKWPKTVSGVSIKQARLSAGRTKTESFTGPFLFTHTGITGPAVFALSSLTAFEDFGPTNPLPISIDFVPDNTSNELVGQLKNKTLEHPKKLFKNILHFFVPSSVAEIIINEYKLPGEKTNGEISKSELEKTATTLKKVLLNAVVRGAGDEFVTAGGIELGEVNPKTMESKLCPGLFFAGEILNIDGFTGGFNLQAAWATGRVAGENAGQ